MITRHRITRIYTLCCLPCEKHMDIPRVPALSTVWADVSSPHFHATKPQAVLDFSDWQTIHTSECARTQN